MPAKRPILLYCVLAFLLILTLVYQSLFLPALARRESKNFPFFFVEAGTNRVIYHSAEAVRLGVRENDAIVAVNGKPYTGSSVLSTAFTQAQVGSPLQVTLVPSDPARGGQKTIDLPVTWQKFLSWDTSSDVVLHVLLPGVSLLLGFWVAFRRPSDSLAWLLLALMLSFPQILHTFVEEGLPPGWRVFAVFYDTVLTISFPIVIFLFGRYFPEPFAPGSLENRIWGALQWLCALPFGVIGAVGLIVAIGTLDNYRAVAGLQSILHQFRWVTEILGYILVGSFFSATGIKLGRMKSADARRRLRFLYWGAVAGFTPVFVTELFAMTQGKDLSELLPGWAVGLIVMPLILFPLSLSYVIVVQKAMGVGVALRQGLQYAFARGGINVLQWTARAIVIFAAITVGTNRNHDLRLKIVVIVLGVIASFTIGRVAKGLRTWVDRRFFRETYDTDHVLAELSEQVRSITEPRSLLETVTTRISDTLHIPQVAVLLANGGFYQPAFAMGYAGLPPVAFAGKTGTAMVLESQKEPAKVFLNDRDSWLYRDVSIGDEERSKLATLRSELLLPLSVRNKLLGFISLGPKQSEEPYTRSDVRLLQSVASQTGLALENASLMTAIAEEVAQRERLNREVEIAREVQERLFPQKLPLIQGLDFAAHCRPALGVGGDYYDFLALPQGQLGVAIGDVSGKGIAAALMMASLQASLRSEATRGPENLAAAVASINRLVYEASASNRYATFFYGQYDPGTRRFDYVNAGHNAPIIFRAGGENVVRLDPGGTVIGLLENVSYEQGSVILSPGDVLVAFTDGISEAMNLEDEEWGEEMLIETVRSTGCSQAKQLLDDVFLTATNFAGAAPQHDDMTLVVLRAY